jgi:NaMN:DMB phosphoribosyltransferase
VEWVVREGVGAGGEMTQALYAHMNNKIKKKKEKLLYTQKKDQLEMNQHGS